MPGRTRGARLAGGNGGPTASCGRVHFGRQAFTTHARKPRLLHPLSHTSVADPFHTFVRLTVTSLYSDHSETLNSAAGYHGKCDGTRPCFLGGVGSTMILPLPRLPS